MLEDMQVINGWLRCSKGQLTDSLSEEIDDLPDYEEPADRDPPRYSEGFYGTCSGVTHSH